MSEKTKQLHTCITCGKTSTKKGHLCTPAPSSFVCEFCGAEAVDSRHLCFPKVEQLRYVCEGCGRVAVNRSNLCAPRQIPLTVSARPGKPAKKTDMKASASPDKKKKKK